MDETLLKEFANPPSKYRGKPFWAWNAKLDPEELRRQVRIMHRMGLGGFFMHSRVGLETPYLSHEWFECIRASIREAEKLGMEAWLYDEDRWPSGAAGGLATRNRTYRIRHLIMEERRNAAGFQWSRDTVAAFTAKVDGAKATGIRRLHRKELPEKLSNAESLLTFHTKLAKGSTWYNGQTYLDTLNPEAVREFIRVTHEAYRKRFGRHLGRTVPGIFTDEPNFYPVESWTLANALPWTSKLPQVFKKRYGYDIIPHLVELYFDVDGTPVTPARLHYHDCVTHMFVEAFVRQVAEWCEKNKLLLTGHALSEELLSSITRSTGSLMRFLEHMHVPGMDLLTQLRREYDTAKQVASAARQFGRKWRLSEMYSRTGWDFPFSGHKALGDWQTALGINLRCHHLSWYSMEGQRKRDRPASIFYQSPWWELYPKVEDYFARIHTVMTRGADVRDLLVMHPVESMWALCKKGWLDGRDNSPEVKAYDSMLVELRDTLLAENIDFDYGDEDILARHGKIVRRSGRAELKVSRAAYRAVVVPPLLTMRSSTLALLKKFQKAGGTVVFAGGICQYVDGSQSTEAIEFAEKCARTPAKGRALVRAVESTCRRVSIAAGDGRQIVPTLHLLKEDKDAFYLFVCNVGYDFVRRTRGTMDDIHVRYRKASFSDVRIRGFAECAGAPLEFDPDTGEVFAADAKRRRDGWEIRTKLTVIGSRLFVIPKRRIALKLPRRQALTDVRRRVLRKGKWEIALSEINDLVLDRPRYRISRGRWCGPEEILRVDRAVRNALGIPPRSDRAMQPWARKRHRRTARLTIELSYDFDVKDLPSGDLYLALEQPARLNATVNDETLTMDSDCGWWTDRSLRKIRFDASLLHEGRNEIRLRCDYDESHPGLEAVYLLGTFGTVVKGTDVTITRLPTTLKLDDWVKQGLAFYSGSVSYLCRIRPNLRKGERLFVQIPAYEGVAVRVRVNGKTAGVIAWEPNEVEITQFLERHGVHLCIEVIGHRRNSHGPLHLAEKLPRQIAPGHYETTGKQWTDAYRLVPCGLMRPPVLVVRK